MKAVLIAMRLAGRLVVLTIVAVVLLRPLSVEAAAPCPATPPPPGLDAPAATVVPADVCNTTAVPGIPIAFFDDYSWRTFIALVWPASPKMRGAPDPAKKLNDDKVPLVFETYKADWETFRPNGTPPVSFNNFIASPQCPRAKPGDFVLGSATKFGNVGEAGIGNLASVLVSQNGRFVRYLAAYNETEFNQILGKKYYLAANLPQNQQPIGAPITLPFGSVDIKSSWIDMTTVAHPERFHTRDAWLQDPITGRCSTKPLSVGLVGLHIVQKTPSRPQWIWTTFEQVDNVPPPNFVPQTPPSQTFTFNDGTGKAMPPGVPPANVWITAMKAGAPPPPFNVQRLTPVNPSTAATNATWQAALKAKNSVWQFYQLTMTQWPVPGNAPTNPGTPAFSFPGNGATSAFANTTLETWDQTNIRGGCMNCHNFAQSNDFLWSLQMNAFAPPKLAAATLKAAPSPEIAGLRSLLQDNFK